ncbi:MAG TPA: cobalamin-binding protein [Janthinobacterium sp.]|nr:cobalamin-binding protein [Janthinobacterium sp.]
MRAPLLFLLLLAAAGARAAVSVRDDAGNYVTLARPARRVVSMSPHATELLFAAGGGAQVLGAMNFSDYPEAAKRLPLIGSDQQIDIERLLAPRPDLQVVWQSGNTARQLEQLHGLGIPMFYSEPRRLDDVADSLMRLGRLLGSEAVAGAAAADFRRKIAALTATYAARAPVRVFYQVWDKPLYTLNGRHIVSDALRVCGARKVFAALEPTAPSVGVEAVLRENPEMILGGDCHAAADAGINLWRPYKSLLAVQRGNLAEVDGDALSRPTPRMAAALRIA